MTEKTCSGCGGMKPLTSYNRDARAAGGISSRCRECKNAEQARWRERNPDRLRAFALKRYGITQDDYDRMFHDQGGVCAICQRPEKRIDPRWNVNRRLAVDHDHVTGAVRGLLCGNCNQRLSWFEQFGEAAAKYLAGVA